MYKVTISFAMDNLRTYKQGEILPSDFTTQDEITDLLEAGYIIEYDGSLEITENGTYDVREYETAEVNVAGGGGNLQEKEITITEDGTTVLTPDTGYDGFSKVTIKTQVSGLLPKQYQAVEFIGSSGTQYINTGVNANSEIKISLDVKIKQSVNAGGLYGGGLGWANSYIQGELDDVSYFAFYNYTTFVYLSYTQGATVNLVQDKNIIYADDVQKTSFTYTQFTTNVPITLFAVNRNNEISEYGTYSIKGCKIYNDNELVRDLYPCYRKSDNEIGMYDLITQTFYTNDGTGTFEKGQNITI